MQPWEWELIGRMALGAALGYAIGFEREFRGKSAGERTFALVALGTAAVTAIGQEAFGASSTRVIQGVMTGVGFLGAGLIFQREQGIVLGLTTAASVWAIAAIGVLAGSGAYVAAILGTALVVFILELDKLPVIRRVEPRRLRDEQRGDGGAERGS
jgi:putative Mg2+ transporter-C (MgtC) family protein